MGSRSPPLSKWGQREDDDDESCRRKKLGKGKEPATKDIDEEPLFDDTKFVIDLLRRAFTKLEDVGTAFEEIHKRTDKFTSSKESGRADLKEAFLGVPTSNRS
jgi:hypothetical protein